MAFKFAAMGDEPATGKALKISKLDPFDLTVAKKEFEIYRKKIEQIKLDANAFEVTDPPSNDLAVTMMGQARRISKAVTTLKDEKLKPHNEFRTQLISFAKAFSSPLEDAVSILKKKTEHFAYQEILKKRAREKEEMEAARKRQQAMDAEAERAGVQTVIMPQVPVDQEMKVQTRTETGSSLSITLEWHGIIMDAGIVPREYCVPDQKKIDEAVKAGLREMPGVEIKEVPKSRLLA